MKLMVAPDQFLTNIKSLVSILGAYYCGIFIQYSVLPKLFPGRRFLPLWVQLVLGFIPCLVVILDEAVLHVAVTRRSRAAAQTATARTR